MNRVWLRMLPSFIQAQLNGRHNLQKILGNTSWLFFDKMLRMGVGLFIGIWIARYLGPEQFGALNFAIATVALFGAFASLGLDGIVVRDIAREPERQYELLSSAFVLKLCGGGLAFLISLGAIFIMRPADSQAHWLVGIIAAGMIFQSFDAIDLWFQSQVQSKYTVLAKNGAFVILAVVRVFLLLNKAPLIAFAYAALAEIILGAAGLIMFYVRQQTLPLWCPRKDTARRLLGESWPLMLSGLAIMIYVKIDQVMLGSLLNNKAVGVYSAATRISEIWYFVPMSIASSLLPIIVQIKQQSELVYYAKLQSVFDTMAILAYTIILPITFLSNKIILLLYGNLYYESAQILTIHIWAGLFVFLGVARGLWILAEGYTKISLYTTSIGALLNVVLNFYLIPQYGALGAAIATVISYCFSDYIIFITIPGLRKIGILMTKSLLFHFCWGRKVNAQ
jgi:polysaccharide transporter, PST family